MQRQGSDSVKEIKTLTDSIDHRITRIEEALYQTKAKSAQDLLNYPIRLNDQISGLYDYAASGNYAPTKQVKEAYKYLAERADLQLDQLKNVLTKDVLKLNELIKQSKLSVIGIK